MSSSSLATRMLVGYVLFVLPLVLAGILFDVSGRAMLESDVKAADLSLARAISLETEARLNNAMMATEELANLSAVREVSPGVLELVAQASRAAQPDIDLFYILDPQGKMVFSVPRSPTTMGADFSFRKYFQDAIRSDRPVVSDGRISPTTEHPVATVAYRMVNERGELQGVMATNLSLTELGKAVAAIEDVRRGSTRGVRVSIVDAAGQLLAHYDNSLLLTQATEAIPGLDLYSPDDGGARIAWDATGKEWLLSFSPVSSAGWTVIVQHDAGEAFASRRYFEMGLLAALVFVIVGGCVFWLYLSRQLLAPLGVLSAMNRETASWRERGARKALERGDEIGCLARSLRRMQAEYGRRLNELSLLVETSRTVVSHLDTEKVLDTVLEGMQQLLSVGACAVLATDEVDEHIYIRAGRGLNPDYAESMKIGRDSTGYPVVRALETGSPVQVSDVLVEPEFPGVADMGRQGQYRSLLVVPLHARHSGLVALVAYREDVHHFTPDEVNLVQHFAHHAAMAFENASLYERSLEQERNRLEAIVESMNDGLLLENARGEIAYANRAASAILGVRAEEMVGRNTATLVRGLDSWRGSCDREEAHEDCPWQANCRRDSLSTSPARRDIRIRCFDVAAEPDGRIGRGYLVQDVTKERELDRLRSALVSTVAHELRTPLAAIKGYASTLLQEDVSWDPDSQRSFLRYIDDQASSLADLVANLLDLSRLQAGALRLDRDYCHLKEIVDRTMARLAAATAHHRLVVQLPNGLPLLFVDGRRVEQVIRNLVENAVKYSPRGSQVAIAAWERQGEVVVSVADQGPGIPQEQLDRVFEPFYQVDARLAREYGGAGLGLAICKGFVEACGGRIWVESSPEGSTFSFTLPVMSDE